MIQLPDQWGSYSRYETPDSDISISQLQNIAEIFEMKIEDILAFDEKYVMNNYGEIQGSQMEINNFPAEMKKLYEDKIQLLEEMVKMLKEG